MKQYVEAIERRDYVENTKRVIQLTLFCTYGIITFTPKYRNYDGYNTVLERVLDFIEERRKVLDLDELLVTTAGQINFEYALRSTFAEYEMKNRGGGFYLKKTQSKNKGELTFYIYYLKKSFSIEGVVHEKQLGTFILMFSPVSTATHFRHYYRLVFATNSVEQKKKLKRYRSVIEKKILKEITEQLDNYLVCLDYEEICNNLKLPEKLLLENPVVEWVGR